MAEDHDLWKWKLPVSSFLQQSRADIAELLPVNHEK